VKSNPRTDFGDIDELTASVREDLLSQSIESKCIGMCLGMVIEGIGL